MTSNILQLKSLSFPALNAKNYEHRPLPKSGQRWPLKMVRSSPDPENPTKSCKSRGSNIVYTLKTFVKLPGASWV